MTPYYADESATLYHGDMRDVVPALDLTVDAIVADPPYGETALTWDRWPDGWPTVAATAASSMWCFGSMRMFLERRDEFAAWKLSQDIIWRKQMGTGLAPDRFRRIHEHALHWYRGQWSEVHHDAQRLVGVARARGTIIRRPSGKPQHQGTVAGGISTDDGSRLAESVLDVRNLHGRSTHPTEKPTGILDPLIRYACPPGGLVLDPFAGSGSTAVAARMSGRRAVLIEADERYSEVIARRLAQGVLEVS